MRIQGSNFRWIIGEQIRHSTTRHRGDDFLSAGGERYDAKLDVVAARLFIIGNHLLKRFIFFRHKALHPPDLCGHRGCIGYVWPRQGPCCS